MERLCTWSLGCGYVKVNSLGPTKGTDRFEAISFTAFYFRTHRQPNRRRESAYTVFSAYTLPTAHRTASRNTRSKRE